MLVVVLGSFDVALLKAGPLHYLSFFSCGHISLLQSFRCLVHRTHTEGPLFVFIGGTSFLSSTFSNVPLV